MQNIELQNKKLHICIVTSVFPALTETFITTKALELRRRGHRITVIKNQASGNINSSHLQEVRNAGIEVLEFADLSTTKLIAKAVFKNPLLFIQSLSVNKSKLSNKYKSLLQQKLLHAYSFDIVHFEFSGLALAYLNVIRTLKAKTVVSCRGTAEKVKPISQPQRRHQLEELFSVIDAIHCVSSDMANTIKNYCNQPKKIFVNRPSINVSVFKRRVEYDTQTLKTHILSVGRCTFQKGYLIGLLAMKKLRDKGLSFHWTIVGDGPELEAMLYHVHALHLQDCVTLVGQKSRNEIIELYNKCHLFLLTSVYEGIANVCLEAMAMELPVVVTKSGGMEEVIDDGTDGLLCDVYDPEDIAEKVLKLANDGAERKRLGQNAREKVTATFNLQQQVDVFEDKYYNLVNARS